MKRLIYNRLILLFALCCAGMQADLYAQTPSAIFYSTDDAIFRLIDLNRDGDFFDAFERTTYASSAVSNYGSITASSQDLFVITDTSIQKLQDLNGDGDALDANESLLFADFSANDTNPVLSSIRVINQNTLLITDAVNGTLIRLRDNNGDGDALDANEITLIADNLISPNAITQLNSHTLLVSQSDPASPVRVLEDRNQDGDYFDFAENISYVENQPAGLSIVTVDNRKQRHLRPGQSDVVTYHDANADGDALDANETLTYANNLDQPARMARAAATDTLYVFLNNNPRELMTLRDLNGDGDAHDANEQIVVATGVGNVNDIFVNEPITACTNGDADGSGTITITDLSIFSRILVGAPAPTPVCPLDMNTDGKVDGRDIQPFIAALIGP